mmetsp:Transcript_48633/g.128481  ORF Transcript_48633/g.128481 Transcript_48633/m.128481 type:complete len:220 (+) Transcript_48633:153-812(+)
MSCLAFFGDLPWGRSWEAASPAPAAAPTKSLPISRRSLMAPSGFQSSSSSLSDDDSALAPFTRFWAWTDFVSGPTPVLMCSTFESRRLTMPIRFTMSNAFAAPLMLCRPSMNSCREIWPSDPTRREKRLSRSSNSTSRALIMARRSGAARIPENSALSRKPSPLLSSFLNILITLALYLAFSLFFWSMTKSSSSCAPLIVCWMKTDCTTVSTAKPIMHL